MHFPSNEEPAGLRAAQEQNRWRARHLIFVLLWLELCEVAVRDPCLPGHVWPLSDPFAKYIKTEKNHSSWNPFSLALSLQHDSRFIWVFGKHHATF